MRVGNYCIEVVDDKIEISSWFDRIQFYRLSRANVLQYIAVLENPESKLLSHKVMCDVVRPSGAIVRNVHRFNITWNEVGPGPALGCTPVSLELAKQILTQLT